MDQDDERQASQEPEATAGELGSRCSLCREAITAEHFTLRGLVLCPGCAESIRLRQSGRGNLRRALRLGALTCAVTSVLWFLATAATGRQLELGAVVAGVAIGLAVHQGSAGRGGLRFQILAVLLVYAAFVVRFIPPVFGGMADAIKREHAAAPAPTPAVPAPAAPPADRRAPVNSAAAPSPTPSPAAASPSTLATLKAYFVFAAIAWGLVLASPFLPSTTNALSLLSLAVGMALAFRFNRRPRLLGPFHR